jgi:hypothetical protein
MTPFFKGDHIKFFANGDVGCREANGWIPREEAKDAMIGVEYELDNSNKNYNIRMTPEEAEFIKRTLEQMRAES